MKFKISSIHRLAFFYTTLPTHTLHLVIIVITPAGSRRLRREGGRRRSTIVSRAGGTRSGRSGSRCWRCVPTPSTCPHARSGSADGCRRWCRVGARSRSTERSRRGRTETGAGRGRVVRVAAGSGSVSPVGTATRSRGWCRKTAAISRSLGAPGVAAAASTVGGCLGSVAKAVMGRCLGARVPRRGAPAAAAVSRGASIGSPVAVVWVGSPRAVLPRRCSCARGIAAPGRCTRGR